MFPIKHQGIPSTSTEAYVEISATILQMFSWSKIRGKLDKKKQIQRGLFGLYGFRGVIIFEVGLWLYVNIQ